MGTPGKEGSNDVVNGNRIKIRSDGTIISNNRFKATRGAPGGVVVPMVSTP